MPFERRSMAGQPYYPSNATEGDIFIARYCQHCRRGFRNCDILLSSFAGEDAKEWRFNAEGVPICKAFEDELDPPPPTPRCPDTLDMFGSRR